MEDKALSTKEKLLLLGIFHYALAIVLIIIKFAPFNVDLSETIISEQTYILLLADSIIMGSIFYALSGPLQKEA
jgi:hypothetical protein